MKFKPKLSQTLTDLEQICKIIISLKKEYLILKIEKFFVNIEKVVIGAFDILKKLIEFNMMMIMQKRKIC